jgi:hypothetical protein
VDVQRKNLGLVCWNKFGFFCVVPQGLQRPCILYVLHCLRICKNAQQYFPLLFFACQSIYSIIFTTKHVFTILEIWVRGVILFVGHFIPLYQSGSDLCSIKDTWNYIYVILFIRYNLLDMHDILCNQHPNK